METTNINIPAIKLICFLWDVNHPITFCPDVADTIANNNRGNPMPIPNTMKLSKLVIKLVTDVLTANKTANPAGLQGRTIAPKKSPNSKALK